MPYKPLDLLYACNLPPKEAIKYFAAKKLVLSWDWQDLWEEAHDSQFTVAKCARMDVLQDIKEELDLALEKGIPFQAFKKDLMPRLQAKGWWGKPLLGDGKGAASAVQLGSPRRLETIYRTNMQSAYMAGRYKAFMQNTDDRPYFQYVAVMDSKTRPAHRALNGLVFRYDDIFWKTHWPPNDYRCRCRTRALTADEVSRLGIEVSEGKGNINWKDVLVNKETGEMRQVAIYTDPITRKAIATGAGFSHNPGMALFKPDLNKYDPSIKALWDSP